MSSEDSSSVIQKLASSLSTSSLVKLTYLSLIIIFEKDALLSYAGAARMIPVARKASHILYPFFFLKVFCDMW